MTTESARLLRLRHVESSRIDEIYGLRGECHYMPAVWLIEACEDACSRTKKQGAAKNQGPVAMRVL